MSRFLLVRNLAQVGLLLLLLVGVALVGAVVTMHFAIHGAEVKVPALKGMTTDDARRQTAGLSLNLDVDNRYYSAEVAAGHILTQTPAPGTVVRSGWRVRVAESLGPQTVNVPDIVGTDERMAELDLRRAGLGVGTTILIPWPHAVPGTILAQDPPGKAQGIARPSVDLLVAAADDEQPDGYVMPDLTGLTLATANAEITHAGLKAAPPKIIPAPIAPVGHANEPLRPPVRSGTIQSQQPLPGERVDAATLVHLVVAR